MKKLSVALLFGLLVYCSRTSHAAITGSNGFTTSLNPANGAPGSPGPTQATEVAGTDAGGLLRVLRTDAAGNLQTGRTWSLLNTTDSVNSVQSGTWSTGRTWTLLNTTDSVNVGNFPATQAVTQSTSPWIISGTVTANAGTNLNTSLLALENGGHLASIDTKLTAPLIVAGQSPVGSAPVNPPLSVSGIDSGGFKRHLLTDVDGTLHVNGSGVTQPISVSALPLPTGASTSANQVTAQTSLSAIQASVANIPASPSTAGNQTAANSSLASIDSKITAVNTGAVVVSSSALPTGAAIAANQLKNPPNTTGSGATGTVSTVITLTPPANAVGFLLTSLDTSTANIRWAIGRVATTSVGAQLQPGRDTGFIPVGTNVSIVAESGSQNYDISWVSQ